MSFERAAYYVVREAWVEVDSVSGAKAVVLEVQGVRADGSYWVTGFQVRLPYDQFIAMTDAAKDTLIAQKIRENEAFLTKVANDIALTESETAKFKASAAYTTMIGRKYKVDGSRITMTTL